MCGIFGVITQKDEQLGTLLLDAGKRLSYKGYDSVGCATFHESGETDLRKDVGKIELVSQRLGFSEMTGQRGFIHLRWATFGSPSAINAQPHLDSDGDLVGVHNGNVVNHVELRKEFVAEGMTIRSTNDGESCVHAVERYVNRGMDLVDACRLAYKDLAGDFAFVIGKVGENRLVAFRKGVVLVAGIGENNTFVATDLTPILPLTRKILYIQDDEVAVLYPDQVEVHQVEDGAIIERNTEIAIESIETAQKAGFAHFMLKEIYEQPKVAGELVRLLEDSPNTLSIIDDLAKARNLYLVGCGSSYHASLLGSFYLAAVAGKASIPVMATQFVAQYGPVLKPGDVAVFISQSGETKDLLIAEKVARQHGVRTMGLVNRIGSSLTRVTERYLPIACGYEISVPATKTFLNQSVALLYLALQLGDLPATGLSNLPALLSQTLQMTEAPVQQLAQNLSGWPEMYCLGLGATYPIALEGALKIKQITYAHCEGMLSTEFKYGSLSAVSEHYPVMFVAGPADIPNILSSLNEVACRGGNPIVIGEENVTLRENAGDCICLPQAGPLLNPIISILPLQLLAYHMAIARGLDPDFPRNLSKTIPF